MYHPKVEIQNIYIYIYIYQSKVELQERINKREREREREKIITFFLEENVRQITKLYKRR